MMRVVENVEQKLRKDKALRTVQTHYRINDDFSLPHPDFAQFDQSKTVGLADSHSRRDRSSQSGMGLEQCQL
jgi:hypothetical protein